jgi:type IV secretory pathway VirB3-like protein
VLIWEATYTNFIVFGLTRSGLEHTICFTRRDHTNHYITVTVIYIIYKNCLVRKISTPCWNVFCHLRTDEARWFLIIFFKHYKKPAKRVDLVHLVIISLKINLFSSWYSWKITELALNNNHSLFWKKSLKDKKRRSIKMRDLYFTTQKTVKL